MCNLYDIGPARRSEAADPWEETFAGVLGSLPKRFGIRRADPAPVLVLEEGEVSARAMRWGFRRPYNNAVNSARSERLVGLWSEAWKDRRRCLIPMSAFYEWTGPRGSKQAYAFVPREEGGELWAAGLWEFDPDGSRSFTMLTLPATPEAEVVHPRMPALLLRADLLPYLEQEDPRDRLGGSGAAVKIFPCENPLRDPGRHRGPVPVEFLPGLGPAPGD